MSPEKKDKTIKEKTRELTELLDWFNGENFDIETAVSKFKLAESLAKEIEQDLMSIKNEVKQIKQKFDSDTE